MRRRMEKERERGSDEAHHLSILNSSQSATSLPLFSFL
jgi:hypothetical protein